MVQKETSGVKWVNGLTRKTWWYLRRKITFVGLWKKKPFPGHSQRKIHPDVIFSETAGVMV